MTYEEIQKELRSLSERLSGEDNLTEEECNSIEERIKVLQTEQNSLKNNAEKRDATLKKVANSLAGEVIETAEERKEINKMNEDVNYRSAFYKKMLNKELNEEETRALSTSSTAVIPTTTVDKIFAKMVQLVPLLGEIELLKVPGNVKFAVESVRSDAGYHEENSTGINTDSTATLVDVTLGGYEFTKLIKISASLLSMSIDAFEDWLVDMLSESIATKIEYEIVNGSGSGAVKGINALTYVNGTNAVQYNGSTGVTETNVRTLIGLLAAGYDAGAKFLMNKKTLFNQIMGLQDKSKHDIVRIEGNKYFIYGYPIILSDAVSNGVIFLGNFKKYVGNLSTEIEVKNGFDIDTNSYKYLGVATFDGKPALTDAFLKMAASL